MSTKNVQYGIIDANQFTKLMFSHTKGQPTMKIFEGLRLSCQLYDKPDEKFKQQDKLVSFAYDLDFESAEVPITNRRYSNNLFGYLAIDWPRTNIKSDTYFLKIVQVSQDAVNVPGFVVGTVQINDLFDCFTTAT